MVDIRLARLIGRRFDWQYAGTGIGEDESGMRRWRVVGGPDLGAVIEADIDWNPEPQALWRRIRSSAGTPVSGGPIHPTPPRSSVD